MRPVLVLLAALAGTEPIAAAQSIAPEPETPRVTIRLHAGPTLNVMREWRDGLATLESAAAARGLPTAAKACFCVSWGAAALMHVKPRVAVGAQFEMLRDTRRFTADDILPFSLGTGTFGFNAETTGRTYQAVAALYPRRDSRVHVQAGAGMGSTRLAFSTPGSGATGRGTGFLLSGSVGLESKFWYVDAGWRLHRVDVTYADVSDQSSQQRRDLFADAAEVRDFVEGRDADLSGGWIRIGLAFRFGRMR